MHVLILTTYIDCARAYFRFVVRVTSIALLRAVVHNAQYGTTALIWAAREGYADSVRLLIDAGADTEAKSQVRVSCCLLAMVPSRLCLHFH
jgi:ankyrin repeat protein